MYGCHVQLAWAVVLEAIPASTTTYVTPSTQSTQAAIIPTARITWRDARTLHSRILLVRKCVVSATAIDERYAIGVLTEHPDVVAPPDAVYNYTSKEWACCGQNTAGNVTCNDPTDEVFQAPAPANLATLSAGATTAATATMTPGSAGAPGVTSDSSTTASGTGTTQVMPSQSHQPDTTTLSIAAKAGIGVGAGLGILVIIAAIVFTLARYKRHNLARKSHGAKTYDHIVEKDAVHAYTGTAVDNPAVEISAGNPPAYAHELDASR